MKNELKKTFLVSEDENQDEDILEKERKYCVIQHNELIRNARFFITRERRENEKTTKRPETLTATERKFILYLISRITPETMKFERERIDIKRFYEIIGADANDGDQYTKLKRTVSEMFTMDIKIFDKDYPRGKTLHFLSWIADEPAPGTVELKLNDDLIPYLLELASNYTQYSFRNVLCMNSKHAIILYQLLKSYAYNRPGIIFSIDALKANLEATSYKQFSDFKKRVIIPAIRDINKYSDLEVSEEYIKSGRAVTHVKFNIKSLEHPKTLDDIQKAQLRYDAVTKKIDPYQITFTDVVGGEYP